VGKRQRLCGPRGEGRSPWSRDRSTRSLALPSDFARQVMWSYTLYRPPPYKIALRSSLAVDLADVCPYPQTTLDGESANELKTEHKG
jgi:hypothetical protein